MAYNETSGAFPAPADDMSAFDGLTDPSRDFMFVGYDLIREPLNLCRNGQEWFTDIYKRECGRQRGLGLVLGATPWLARLLGSSGAPVAVVDASPAMLRLSRETLLDGASSEPQSTFQFIEANWTDLPAFNRRLRVAVGDNSFNYLAYPEGWLHLCDQLAERMRPEGLLLARMCSVPHRHRTLSVDEIIDQFVSAEEINYTAVRASLLFAHLDPLTYEIDTEAVLDTFENNIRRFDRLFARFPVLPDNDLVTVRKYRGADARYVAPPLTEIVGVLCHRFVIRAVYFGPYQMSEYFPLIVASRR